MVDIKGIQSNCQGNLTLVRGLYTSVQLLRERAQNSDAFSPDGLNARVWSMELLTAMLHR